MIETWLPVPGFEGYYDISDQGHPRSLPRQTARGVRGGGPLKLRADRNGYLYIDMSKHGQVTRGYLHQLVLETFVGPCPEGMEGAHGDGDQTNNALINLSWKTKSGNMLDSVRHGTHRNASKQTCPACGGDYSLNGRGQRVCRSCTNTQQRESYAQDPSATLDRQQARRAADPEHVRAIERESKRRSRARKKAMQT